MNMGADKFESLPDEDDDKKSKPKNFRRSKFTKPDCYRKWKQIQKDTVAFKIIDGTKFRKDQNGYERDLSIIAALMYTKSQQLQQIHEYNRKLYRATNEYGNAEPIYRIMDMLGTQL